MVFEIGAGAVTPTSTAYPKAGGNLELVPDTAMHPLGDGFRRLDGQAVDVVEGFTEYSPASCNYLKLLARGVARR